MAAGGLPQPSSRLVSVSIRKPRDGIRIYYAALIATWQQSLRSAEIETWRTWKALHYLSSDPNLNAWHRPNNQGPKYHGLRLLTTTTLRRCSESKLRRLNDACGNHNECRNLCSQNENPSVQLRKHCRQRACATLICLADAFWKQQLKLSATKSATLPLQEAYFHATHCSWVLWTNCAQ